MNQLIVNNALYLDHLLCHIEQLQLDHLGVWLFVVRGQHGMISFKFFIYFQIAKGI